MFRLFTFIALTISLLFSHQSFARACQVYGISDGPQLLQCTFKNGSIKLSCVNGNYFLNKSKVKVAYHLDVEYGSSPLVFKSRDLNLTVVQESKVDIKAKLKKKNGKVYSGTCI
ncbi:MAG TPA: hypothetical protein VNJ01_07750 [Bacteriovoracaceae bacterium]|nr:hypothetical protein [Bacteriovoracaceae bacterium]